MRGNWNVKRERPSMTELTQTVTDLTKATTEALKEHGLHSREYLNAEFTLRMAERKLDAATHEEERRKASSNRTPREIVDDVMGR